MVALLSAKILLEQDKVATKEKLVRQLRIDLEALERTMDRRLAVVHQDMEAEFAEHLLFFRFGTKCWEPLSRERTCTRFVSVYPDAEGSIATCIWLRSGREFLPS